jgi:hypothetical protein
VNVIWYESALSELPVKKKVAIECGQHCEPLNLMVNVGTYNWCKTKREVSGVVFRNLNILKRN